MKSPRLKTFGPRLRTIDTRKVKPPEKAVEPFYSSREWQEVRALVLKRDNWTCVRPGCGRHGGRFGGERMFVDHIVERKDGGADLDPANLEVLCSSCHVAKTHAERVERHGRRY